MPIQSSLARFGLGTVRVIQQSISLAGSGAFVTRYDTTGNIQWAARITGNAYDSIKAVAIDSSANVYVTGSFAAPTLTFFNASGTQFGTLSRFGTSGYDAFVAKYNSSGTVQWTARMGSSGGGEEGFGISVDSSGNVHVIGYYSSLTFDIYNGNGTYSTSLARSANVSTDTFIVKYNTSGTVQWATRITGSGGEQGFSITTDTSSNVYVTGLYNSSPVTIFSANGTSSTLAGDANANCFVVKYNSSGNRTLGLRISGSLAEAGYGITVDSSQNIYVTGTFGSSPLTFFNANGTDGGTLSNLSTTMCFVVRYASNGFTNWITCIGSSTGSSSSRGNDIAVDNSSGDVYVIGFYQNTATVYSSPGTTVFGTLAGDAAGNCFVVKYNSTGTARWAVRILTTSIEEGFAIDIDGSANVYVTGYSGGSPITVYNANGTQFTSLTGSTNGFGDCFIVKYNASGAGQWATRIVGTGDDRALGIAVTTDGSVFVAGQYTSAVVLYSTGF